MMLLGLVVAVVALALIGNAMASPAERSAAKASVDRFARRYLLIPTIAAWALIIWAVTLGSRPP